MPSPVTQNVIRLIDSALQERSQCIYVCFSIGILCC